MVRQMFMKIDRHLFLKIDQQLFKKIDQQMLMKIGQQMFHTIETDSRHAGANQQMFLSHTIDGLLSRLTDSFVFQAALIPLLVAYQLQSICRFRNSDFDDALVAVDDFSAAYT